MATSASHREKTQPEQMGIGLMLGGAIGLTVGGLAGGAIGATIGGVLGAMAGQFIEHFAITREDHKGGW
jgi:outer membrane lipoprotein SlyB